MIKIGDYIEGYEEIPDKRILRIHKTRIVVQHININNGESIYYGKADDDLLSHCFLLLSILLYCTGKLCHLCNILHK